MTLIDHTLAINSLNLLVYSSVFNELRIDQEPELEPGFHLNYPGSLFCELPGFFRFGSNPGSIPTYVS